MAKEKKLSAARIKIEKDAYIRSLDGFLKPIEGFNIINSLEIIGSIEILLNNIEQLYPDILQECVNKVKDAIQREAANNWYDSDCWSMLTMATGTGKSKIPINILKDVFNKIPHQKDLRILLCVPTEKLRDENWKEEFQKWDALHIYTTYVVRTCYASLDNFEGEVFDLVIGDEFHNITEDKAVFFEKNRVKRLICLTATPPTDKVKLAILKHLKISISYNVPLDIAVRLKLVAPYNVTVVECRLDDVIKNVASGTKAVPFMTTEKKAYDYKTNLINTTMYSQMPALQKATVYKYRVIDRMRFLKNLESRTKNAKFILEKFIQPEERVLIFCGGIEQAIELCPYRYFSKPSCKKTDPTHKKERVARILAEYQGDESFNKFVSKEINQMSCVEAVNEGHNIPDVDTIFVVCVESGEKTITQQIGRGIRFAIGHNCRVIIMIITDTQDEKWFETAVINLDRSKFRHVRMANLINGVETI